MVINVNFKILLIISKLSGIIDETGVLKKRFFCKQIDKLSYCRFISFNLGCDRLI